MENETSLWNKKQDEMTVGDSLKVGGVVMVASIVIPLVAVGAVGLGCSAWERLQERRADRKAKKDKK